jgi:hypothetical protein
MSCGAFSKYSKNKNKKLTFFCLFSVSVVAILNGHRICQPPRVIHWAGEHPCKSAMFVLSLKRWKKLTLSTLWVHQSLPSRGSRDSFLTLLVRCLHLSLEWWVGVTSWGNK